MSKLSEYSKFDHLVDSDDEDENNQVLEQPLEALQFPACQSRTRKDESTGRYVFEYNGTKIYEWEQTLEEVNLYIQPPSGTKANDLDVLIQPRHFKLGLRGFDRYFIDEPTYGDVDMTESSWYLDDDGIVNIVLIKAHKGETWESALKGKEVAVDPFTKQQIQKELMLERFQEENPGLDFRGADFNGSVPDPRTFMGGVKYS
jgi:hypothetical protein